MSSSCCDELTFAILTCVFDASFDVCILIRAILHACVLHGVNMLWLLVSCCLSSLLSVSRSLRSSLLLLLVVLGV